MKKVSWQVIYSLAVFLLVLILFYPRSIISFRYDSDFARDVTEIYDITQGDIRLTGPKLSFGGIFTGPYYYYLFAPAMFIFAGRPEMMVYFNLIIFALGAGIISWILSQYQKNKKSPVSSLMTLWLMTTSYYIFSIKNPGNAFSYLPLLTILLASFPLLTKSKKIIHWLVWGFLYGVVVNFHLISVVTIFSLILVYIITNLKQKNLIKNILSVVIGFSISFIPLLIFEFRHNFVIFKNTFIDKSYEIFTKNQNLPNPLVTSKNPAENLLLLIKHFGSWYQPSFTWLILFTMVLAIFLFWKKRIKVSSTVFKVFVSSFLAFLILAVIARSQLAFHYFYPFILMMQIGFILLITKLKRYQTIVLLLLVLINVWFWPKHFFSTSNRLVDNYRTTTNQIVGDEDFGDRLKSNSFNVFVVRETPLAVLGWEYRYFLKYQGLIPLGIQEYNQAQYLLLIDESAKSDVESMSTWELDQFGLKQKLFEKTISGRKVYLFEKE